MDTAWLSMLLINMNLSSDKSAFLVQRKDSKHVKLMYISMMPLMH